MALLTARTVDALKPGETATDKAPRGAGRLQVRKLSGGGLAWYYRYTGPDGERVRLAIGTGLTLAQARAEVEALRRRYQQGDKALREALEADEAAKRAEIARQQREAEALAARGTVGDLLEAYADALEAQGKVSAPKVRKALQLHVREALPNVWALHAQEFQPEHAVEVLSKLHADGKDREAAKVRAYLRAAFARAVRARLDAKASQKLRALAIASNPVADLPPSEEPTGSRERALSVEELRAYWRRLQAEPEPYGAMLRLHLLSGAQRVEQLGRLTLADWDRDAHTVTLWDSKGRRAKPRAHVVPLLEQAAEALRVMRPDNAAEGAHLFTADRGTSAAGYHVARLRVARIAAAMVEAGEAVDTFTLGDLRRTVETRLAAAGVSLEVRAQLQSHGLGGVQAKHYDRHGYAVEKREALEILASLLEAPAAKVTRIRAAGAAR